MEDISKIIAKATTNEQLLLALVCSESKALRREIVKDLLSGQTVRQVLENVSSVE